jgi:hypothetical protein
LSFEAHFKRRPVLVLAILEENNALLVAPLSSQRRYGQERAVTHTGGVSYLTGRAAEVPRSALLTPLGAWEGFADWRNEQQHAAEAAARARNWLARGRAWLLRRLRR